MKERDEARSQLQKLSLEQSTTTKMEEET